MGVEPTTSSATVKHSAIELQAPRSERYSNINTYIRASINSVPKDNN